MSKSYGVVGDGLFERARGNPLLTPERWPYRINAVMNAAATTVGDDTLLLCRVEDRRGFSHLTIARSKRRGLELGRRRPSLPGAVARPPGGAMGCRGPEDHQDRRTGRLGDRLYGIRPGRAGRRVGHHPGLRLGRSGSAWSAPPEDKNASLLPRRVDGEFVMFHRPVSSIGGRADVWISRSADLHSWSAPEPVFGARPGGWWDSARIGVGPPPLETAEGWLVVYHGVRQTVAGALYRVGLAMLDLENPAFVTKRCDEWVLGPAESLRTDRRRPRRGLSVRPHPRQGIRSTPALLRGRRLPDRHGVGELRRRAGLCP